ncbi:Camk/cdpk protein kinase [Globisporangium polare]
MGCHQSKDSDVVASTSATRKGGRRSRRSDRATFRDDVTSDLVQHTYVDDIDECFEFHSTIGMGHFGCVKHATSRKSGKEWAVKIVKLNNEVDKDALRNEINILKRLHHPQIVRVIASYEDKEHMYMVMQLCKGKELYEHLYKENRKFSEEDVRKIIRGLLRAVAFLHSNFITHRDLKLENLLLENAENPSSLKLCDFGLSTRFKRGEKMQKSLGTIDYVAPEVLDGDYTEKCDLWSVGVICFELLTGVSPFHAPTIDETMGKIFDGILIFDDAIWKHFSPSAIAFVKSLVKEDVDARLSAEQALEHKWLADTDESSTGSERLQNNKRLLLTNMLSFSRCRKMKQTALLSVALGISEDHIQQEMAAEVFHSMDHLKKGTLTREAFCSSMVECGISRPDADDLFTRINQSKTGQINFLEFIAAVMDQRDIGQNTIKEAFGLLDGEKKGRLSIVGLQDVFRNSMVPEEVKEIIASADKKGDGFVEFAEFQDMFTQPNSPLAKVDEVSESHEGFSTDSFAGSDDLEKRATLTSSSLTAVENGSENGSHASPENVAVTLGGDVKSPEIIKTIPPAAPVAMLTDSTEPTSVS